MSKNKQSSSIDFYRSCIIKITADGVSKRITGEQWDLLERKAYEQAKAMHKEEIVKAYNHAYEEGWESNDWQPEQYYNETYGGKNE
jgi:hypothetical protein